ncbi:LysR family transcriptional regulator [Actinocorallia longicatena]
MGPASAAEPVRLDRNNRRARSVLPNVEIRQLRTFLAVVRERTVTDAANALDLAPSSVSQQIRVLEASLGVSLFARSPGGMTLTDAGRRLLGHAPRLLDDLDRIRRDVSGVRERLRFGALETLLATQVPALLARMSSEHPELRIEPAKGASRADLLDDLVAGDLDAVLVLDAPGELGALGFDPPPDADVLAYVDLEPCPVVLAARPGHPLVGRTDLTVRDVRDHPLILGPKLCSFHLAADRIFGPGGARIEVPSIFVATSWAVQGVGLVFLPEFAIAEQLRAGSLVRLDLVVEPAEVWLRLVWRRDREQEPDLRTLLYGATRISSAVL